MPLKAAMITPNLSLGGAERWLVDLIKHSDPARVQWTGCALSAWGGLDYTLGRELAQHTRLVSNRIGPLPRPTCQPHFAADVVHDWTDMDFRSAIREVAKDADVIVTWGAADLGFFLGEYDVPRVCCSHTTCQDPVPLSPISGLTHLVAVSSAAMRYFEGRKGNDLPSRVLYNGADPLRCLFTKTKGEIHKSWGWKASDVVIGYLGRQSPEKNPQAAGLAVSGLPKKYRAAYFGPGPRGNGFCPHLTAWLHENIPGRYRISNPLPDVGDILKGFDVLMLASHREAFSLTLIEAWMAGVPVIATPVGSVPELEAQYGPLTIPVPIDPTKPDLTEAVRAATFSKHRPDQLVKTARALACEKFTIEAMARRWMSYLEEIT